MFNFGNQFKQFLRNNEKWRVLVIDLLQNKACEIYTLVDFESVQTGVEQHLKGSGNQVEGLIKLRKALNCF